jgi:glycosyltransferase involved in cell wall biosynthesis
MTIKTDPDFVFVATTLDWFSIARDVPLLIALSWSRSKKVIKMHGSDTSKFKKKGSSLFKILTKLLISLSDAILLLSKQEIDDFVGFFPGKNYSLVKNPFVPINESQIKKPKKIFLSKHNPRLLFVGRLIREKGIFDLISSLPVIIENHQCSLIVAGDGIEKGRLIQFIQENCLSKYVSLLGYVQSDLLAEVYRSSDIFVLPSYFAEGFPTVFSEAMSYGLPIITTRIRGANDHLEEGVNALFVEPKDPIGIAKNINNLLENEDLYFNISKNNLEKIKSFSPECIVSDYLKIFEDLKNGK